MENSTLVIYAFYAGLNALLMVILALNVSRLRIKNMREKVEESTLHSAVRAHGNNSEHVPTALLGLGIMTLLGCSALLLHILGAGLLVSRLLHAVGIQQQSKDGPPPARIAGNLGTWVIFLVIGFSLIKPFLFA